jgi:competence protein ComEC
MKRFSATSAAMIALVAGLSAASARPATKTLDIYFIDVEGGQSTLIVTPAGQSLLIDTGYPERNGRDPDRIIEAMKEAALSRVDYLLITHLHEDHDGGAAELARRIPIGTFIDYGAPVETSADVVAAFAAYSDVRSKGQHLVPKPGERLPLSGLDVEVVSADGVTLATPLDGGGLPNPECAASEARGGNSGENPRSIGVRVRYGAFRFLDLGDLVGTRLRDLVCPDNLLGQVDVYLIAHHANADTNVPAVLAALKPRVAIANNGAYKGGSAAALATLHQQDMIEDVWQLHASFNDGAVNFPDAFVANLAFGEQDHAAWIKLSASPDGSFSVTNGRTGWTRRYDKELGKPAPR